MDEIGRYREMVARGICAHAAAIHVINYVYMRGKDEGLTLEECHVEAQKMFKQIKEIWTEEP